MNSPLPGGTLRRMPSPRAARPAAAAAATVLLSALDRAFDRRSWHGANLTSALRGVTPAQAAARITGRKTVWEQLLHAAYWKHAVLRKLTTARTPFPRKGSNWPEMPADLSVRSWKADLELLRDLHARLRATVAGLPPTSLTDAHIFLIQGAAAHDLYHAGQIKLLRRLLSQ